MQPVPHGMKPLSIPLLTLLARDLKRGREIHIETWSSERKVCKILYLPPSLDLFCWLLNPFFFWYETLGCEVGFILNFSLVKNNVFQREWHQIKIKDNNIPDSGCRKGQEQVLGFSGSHVYLSKVRKQKACTVPPSGRSVLHILCVHLNRSTVNSHFSEPGGEQNNALNQKNTNLLFPQCRRAHSHSFAVCLHYSCGCLSRMLPCLQAGPDGRKPPHARLT